MNGKLEKSSQRFPVDKLRALHESRSLRASKAYTHIGVWMWFSVKHVTG